MEIGLLFFVILQCLLADGIVCFAVFKCLAQPWDCISSGDSAVILPTAMVEVYCVAAV